jgi:hypothetical protein
MKDGMKIKATVAVLCKHKLTRHLALGVTLFLALYVLTYGVLVGAGERRARAKGINDYDLVFSDPKNEKYESVVCAVFWPIYSVDSIYRDERFYPNAMIPKNMGLRDYVRHCRMRVLDCVGLD